MTENVFNVSLPSGTLVLFDPAALDHRRSAPREWSSDRAELEREVSAAHLAALTLNDGQSAAMVAIEEGAPPASPSIVTARVRVTGKGLFIGDRTELPSQAWGARRRWNLWDWGFALFLLSLPPFAVWLSGFQRDVFWMTAGMSVVFVLLLLPFSVPLFKGGFGFAGRTAIPPKNNPDRLLKFEPGDYMVAIERRGSDGVREQIAVWFGRKA